MSPAWIPVVITALIVLGVVGGSIAQMVLKEILPLLRSMAQERQTVGGSARGSAGGRPEMPPSHDALESIEQRLAQLEAGQQRLQEESDFLQKLLTEGGEQKGAARPPQK